MTRRSLSAASESVHASLLSRRLGISVFSGLSAPSSVADPYPCLRRGFSVVSHECHNMTFSSTPSVAECDPTQFEEYYSNDHYNEWEDYAGYDHAVLEWLFHISADLPA